MKKYILVALFVFLVPHAALGKVSYKTYKDKNASFKYPAAFINIDDQQRKGIAMLCGPKQAIDCLNKFDVYITNDKLEKTCAADKECANIIKQDLVGTRAILKSTFLNTVIMLCAKDGSCKKEVILPIASSIIDKFKKDPDFTNKDMFIPKADDLSEYFTGSNEDKKQTFIRNSDSMTFYYTVAAASSSHDEFYKKNKNKVSFYFKNMHGVCAVNNKKQACFDVIFPQSDKEESVKDSEEAIEAYFMEQHKKTATALVAVIDSFAFAK